MLQVPGAMNIAGSCVSEGAGGGCFLEELEVCWICWILEALEAFRTERLLKELEVFGEQMLEAVRREFV